MHDISTSNVFCVLVPLNSICLGVERKKKESEKQTNRRQFQFLPRTSWTDILIYNTSLLQKNCHKKKACKVKICNYCMSMPNPFFKQPGAHHLVSLSFSAPPTYPSPPSPPPFPCIVRQSVEAISSPPEAQPFFPAL